MIFREESLPHIVSGICDPHDILQNLSEQDICFNSKDLIHSERNAVDLYDKRDTKGQMSFTSFKIWNILDKIFVLIHVQSHALSANQQLQLYVIVFRNVLASNQISAVEEAIYNSLIYYEDFLWTKKKPAIFGSGKVVSATVCPARTRINPALGLYYWRSKVLQWM